ncbi:MAG TPA: GNAT family N-acetyltransferase [Albitalea sp.]|jgi:ribosomal protein S18 acetylase RimI-like enzyme|nr:GNAT family N-acetyltransferase [Albitalea sp.]
MTDDCVIRPLGNDDLGAYKALRDAMLALHPDAFTSDAATEQTKPAASYRARFGGDAADEAHYTLGAWVDDQLVGAISCERDPRLKVRHIGHIVGMMVNAEARGHGIGRRLLEGCIARSRRVAGLEMLTLSVTSSNAAAVALYQRAGFERYGRLARAIKLGGAYHDKDLMVLSL